MANELFIEDQILYGKTERGLNNIVNTARGFGNDIWMEFGIIKYGALNLKKWQYSEAEDI